MSKVSFQVAELAEADSSLTVAETPFVVPGPLTLPLLQGRWNRQGIAASQSLIGDARKLVDVRLGQDVIDHELQEISRGEPHAWPTAGSLKVSQTGSQGRVVRYRHAPHPRRDRLGLLGAED